MTELLGVHDLHKFFPPNVQALAGASLELKAGEVHCLLGSNGAGKSTLVKVLAGAHRPDQGVLTVGGKPVSLHKPQDAVDAGISTIFQELDLVAELTVEQNLLLGRAPSRGYLVRRGERRRQAREALERVKAPFGPQAEVGSLSVANQQLAAIARSLTTESRVLVMDEPSAALDEGEVERVFEVIRDLTASGHAVLYISHRMEEVFEIGDRATVMRNGQTIETFGLAEANEAQLVDAMIGQHRSLLERANRKPLSGDTLALKVRSVKGPSGLDVRDLDVRVGEIIGLAGLGGAGRTTLLNALFGRLSAAIDVDIFGEPFAPRKPSDAVVRGVGLVPEDRKTEGLVLSASIGRNVEMPSLRGRWRSTWQQTKAISEPPLRELSTKYAGLRQPARNLSGGNQQKVVFAKWLARGSKVLLLDEPSRGLDVGAKADLYARVRSLAEAGAAVLIASSDLEELIAHCDRIYVMHEGRNVAEYDPTIVGPEAIQHTIITGRKEVAA